MIRTAVIVLAATAALVAGASEAAADSRVNFGVTIGTPGYHPYRPYRSYGYYPVYDDDCHYVKAKKWVKYHGKWHKKYVKVLVCY